jgi:hypothetical protein
MGRVHPFPHPPGVKTFEATSVWLEVLFFLDFILEVLKLPLCRFTIMSAKTSFVIFAVVTEAYVRCAFAGAVRLSATWLRTLDS